MPTLSERIKSQGFKEVDDSPVEGDITNDILSDDNTLSGRIRKSGLSQGTSEIKTASPNEVKSALGNMSPEQEKNFIQKAGPQNIKNFFIGAGKGLASTVKGIGTISQKVGAFGTGLGRDRASEDPLAGRVISE